MGLTGLTPHDLRHTAASLAAAAGANVKAVQRMLGHASAAMTLDVSGPRVPASLRNLAINALRLAGRTDITEANRNMNRPFTILGLTGGC